MDKVLEAIADNIFFIAAMMVPVAIIGVSSYFRNKRLEMIHRERLAAIEKGIAPAGVLPDPDREEHDRHQRDEGPKTPGDYLQYGLFWLCPGLGATFFSLLFLRDVSAAIRLPILGASMVAAGVGAAYLIIYSVEIQKTRTGLQ